MTSTIPASVAVKKPLMIPPRTITGAISAHLASQADLNTCFTAARGFFGQFSLRPKYAHIREYHLAGAAGHIDQYPCAGIYQLLVHGLAELRVVKYIVYLIPA